MKIEEIKMLAEETIAVSQDAEATPAPWEDVRGWVLGPKKTDGTMRDEMCECSEADSALIAAARNNAPILAEALLTLIKTHPDVVEAALS